MKSTFLVILVILCTAGLTAQIVDAPSPSDTAATKFDPSVDAEKELDSALALARSVGKHVLLDVGGQWCSWCRKLDSLFSGNTEIRNFLHANYIWMKINYSKENRNQEVLSRYPAIEGYPHFFVLDSRGRLLCSQESGALESGDRHDAGKVLTFLRTWAPALPEQKKK